jgi:hypothetical protein
MMGVMRDDSADSADDGTGEIRAEISTLTFGNL